MKLLQPISGQYKIMSILAVLGFIIHIIFGRPRWQLYPLYTLILIYFILVVFNNFSGFTISSGLSRLIIGFGIFLVFISIILMTILPVEKIPKPTGKYLIGTRSYDLIDESRDAVYSDELSEYRKIKFQVWYPSDNVKGYKRGKWIDDGKILARQLANNMHMPYFALDHTTLIDSNSYKNSPISDDLDKYPLVIISW